MRVGNYFMTREACEIYEQTLQTDKEFESESLCVGTTKKQLEWNRFCFFCFSSPVLLLHSIEILKGDISSWVSVKEHTLEMTQINSTKTRDKTPQNPNKEFYLCSFWEHPETQRYVLPRILRISKILECISYSLWHRIAISWIQEFTLSSTWMQSKEKIRDTESTSTTAWETCLISSRR